MTLSLLLVSILISEGTGCIQGYVYDFYGVPMQGAAVFIPGTSLGMLTDSVAHYCISDVPPGIVEIAVRMPAMGEETDSVIVVPGDTSTVNLILASGLQYLPDISWKYDQETYPDTVFFILEDPEDLQLELSQVWAYREGVAGWVDGKLVPSWTLNGNLIAAALPSEVDTIRLRIFPFPEVMLPLDGGCDTVSVRRDQFNTDRTMPGVNCQGISHHLYDISEWGNQEFVNSGLISSRAFYGEDGTYKLLLVYYERAVLIDQTGFSRVIDFPFPTFHYRTDPDWRFLLIWDICGKMDVGGDAAVICFDDEETHIFDPSPEEEIPDRGWHSIGTVIEQDRVPDWSKYHVLSSGDILRLNGSDFRRYSCEGRLLEKQSLHQIGLIDSNYGFQFLSLGQEAVSGVFNDDSLNYCFTIDLEGNLVQQISIPVPFRPVNGTKYISNADSSVFWMYRPLYGLVRIDCISGGCIHIPDIHATCLVASQNREYLGITVFPGSDQSYCEHQIRDWDTGELIYFIPQNNPSRASRILGVTETGSCLISGTAEGCDSETEYSVHNADGEVVPVFRNGTPVGPVNTEATISPTGSTITIPYGRYIDIISLEDSE